MTGHTIVPIQSSQVNETLIASPGPKHIRCTEYSTFPTQISCPEFNVQHLYVCLLSLHEKCLQDKISGFNISTSISFSLSAVYKYLLSETVRITAHTHSCICSLLREVTQRQRARASAHLCVCACHPSASTFPPLPLFLQPPCHVTLQHLVNQ